MPTDGGDTADDAGLLEAVLGEAIADTDWDRAGTPGPVDRGWLRTGIRLGLEQPERARAILELLGTTDPGPAVPLDQDAQRQPRADDAADGVEDPSPRIPVAAALLARASALPQAERDEAGPEVAFGWVTRLTPEQILQLGGIVGEMLAAGSPPDIGRGFGLTWTAGVRVPRPDLETMLGEFTELEITVGGILAGHDLRSGAPPPRPQGLAAWFGDWLPRTRRDESEAAGVIDRSGEPGRRGLIALWNVWMAMRYRTIIPKSTFDLMVHPWVAVVGPIPG